MARRSNDGKINTTRECSSSRSGACWSASSIHMAGLCAPAFCDCADLVSQARGAGIPRPKWAARDATHSRAAGVARKRGRRARRSKQPTKSSEEGRHQAPLSRLTDNLQPMNKERWTGCRNDTESRHDRIHPGSCSWLGSEERAPSPSLPLQNTLVTFLLGELIITAGTTAHTELFYMKG
jgi:hypothetical protein